MEAADPTKATDSTKAADPTEVGRGTSTVVFPFIPPGPLSGFIPVEESIFGEACVGAEALSATPGGDTAPVQEPSVTRAELVSNALDSTIARRWRLWL